MRSAAGLACAALLRAAAGAGSAAQYQSRQVQYGKYWTYYYGVQSYESNTYYLYSPQNVSKGAKLPIIVEFHGGAYMSGSATKTIGPQQTAFVDQGMHYVSVDYRLLGDKHYYGDAASPKEHEFIHAYPNGTLVPDSNGKVMSDYKVKVGRTEFNTMCSYDAAAALEHLIAHADEFGIDVHRIGLTGGSAGGGEIHYLTWVYHALHPEKYTPVSMHYTMAQLDYPVNHMLAAADGYDGGPWRLWADDVGHSTKLSKILAKSDCGQIVGNPWCSQQTEMNLCNQTWHDEGMAKYCGDSFDTVTLGDLVAGRQWPMDSEHDQGLWTLWATSQNILRHQPRGSAPGGKFHLYISNALNGSAAMNVVHNALYARNYARYAEKAGGINYVVYYTDYNGMTGDDSGTERFEVQDPRTGATVYNYRSNFGWVDLPGVRAATRSSLAEYVLFHCHAMGLPCDAAPAPAPPPGTVSASCAAAVDKACPTACSPADCNTCAQQYAGQFIAAGCPGFAPTEAYCEGHCH